MAKNPAFFFYPGDWFREPGLQRVDLDVRGAWSEILMIMHHEQSRGETRTTVEGLARQLRIDTVRACYIIESLEENRIAEVQYCDEDCRKFVYACADYHRDMSPECPDLSPQCTCFVTIKNRRMVAEAKLREYERLKKQKQREYPRSPKHVPEMSPSPSPSTPSPSTPSAVQKKEKTLVGQARRRAQDNGTLERAKEVLAWLNTKSGKNFRESAPNLDLIRARLNSGILPEQLKAIVSRKVREWSGTDQDKYLRPETLFGSRKCEQYLGQLPKLEEGDGMP